MRLHATATTAVAAALLAATATACSGSGSSSSTSGSHDTGTAATVTASPAGQAAQSDPATVTTKDISPFGKVLVGGAKNRTLYLFLADKKNQSTCTGACAKVWPPLLVNGKPTASGGADSKKLGTTKRSDGGTQVTYNGHPLYLFAADTGSGNTRGQGLNNFGAKWYVVGTDGNQITKSGSSSGGGY
ncbi:hypothetical protein [Streptomyces sp. NPDC021224]|uniref:COG4315 family predicted lipoprotein n=1 Tax=unclassified Streptomyces TaxID=2593676 RepID=UPI0037AA3AE4